MQVHFKAGEIVTSQRLQVKEGGLKRIWGGRFLKVSDIDHSMMTEMVVVKIDRKDLQSMVVASFTTREQGG